MLLSLDASSTSKLNACFLVTIRDSREGAMIAHSVHFNMKPYQYLILVPSEVRSTIY